MIIIIMSNKIQLLLISNGLQDHLLLVDFLLNNLQRVYIKDLVIVTKNTI